MLTSPSDLILLTDLYQLTMAQSYLEQGVRGEATFSLAIRSYPHNRGYLIAAGLEDVLDFLRSFSFSQRAVIDLRSTGIFSERFLEHLAGLRFTGSVRAISEGRLFFTNEPVLEVTAPIIEAQIVETFITNAVNAPVLMASKAARCVHAAGGKPVVDFGLRRAQGADAGVNLARSAYLAGVRSTSNVLAGIRYGIPLAGTMAHSFISTFEDEAEAFRAFVGTFPDRSILLIDTYDTLEGARKAAEVGKEMRTRGGRLAGVRLDSGDIAGLSREVRSILDEAGLQEARIFASGGLDEHDIEAAERTGAAIDTYAVGTKLAVSADAPWSDIAYKLVSYAGRPTFKLSQGKATLPGAKQVFRARAPDGSLSHDTLGLDEEPVSEGDPLLLTVMERGRRVGPPPALEESREVFSDEFSALPDRFKALQAPPPFDVRLSPGLAELAARLREERAPL